MAKIQSNTPLDIVINGTTVFTADSSGISITGSFGSTSPVISASYAETASFLPINTYNITSSVSTIAVNSFSSPLKLYTSLGSNTLADPPFFNMANLTTIITPSNQQAFGMAVYLPTSATITGVKWWVNTLGVYTANNYNGVGLYTYSGGTLTCVASSSNDGNIWSSSYGTATRFATKSFGSTYNASPGIYFVLGLYNRSAATTAPILGAATAVGQSVSLPSADFTNSAAWNPFFGSQTSLPSSIAMSSKTASQTQVYFSLY